MRDKRFYEQLEAWHRDGEYQMIIGVIEALPDDERDYFLTSTLARAYNNLAVMSDDTDDIDRDMLERAAALLSGIADEGKNDALWNFRLGYSLFYLGKTADAHRYFLRASELDPSDRDAVEFISMCRSLLDDRDRGGFTAGDRLTVEAHIRRHFGDYSRLLREKLPSGDELDIWIIPPSTEHANYTLITHGMSAHRLNVPDELAENGLDRAELLISIPPDADLEACLDSG